MFSCPIDCNCCRNFAENNSRQIIQEVRLARSVVIACGDSLFHYRELAAITHDLKHVPLGEYNRNRGTAAKIKLTQCSHYLEAFLEDGHADFHYADIGSVVCLHYDHGCYDPRDRVFGTLALTRNTRSFNYIRPDYSKSGTKVALQLIEHKCACDAEDGFMARTSSHAKNFADAHQIVGALRLGPGSPGITEMLNQRRTMWHKNNSARVPEKHGLSPNVDSRHRMVMNAVSYCRVRKNEAGEFIVPMFKRLDPAIARAASAGDLLPHHDSLADREATSNAAVRLRTPTGTVVAWADCKTQAGDILLFFQDDKYAAEEPWISIVPPPGLAVSQFKDETFTVVGQFFITIGARPCSTKPFRPTLFSEDSDDTSPSPDISDCSDDDEEFDNEPTVENRKRCRHCKGANELHSREGWSWKIHMSPEDLLLFVAQDLKLEHRSPELKENFLSTVDFSVYPEERVTRLRTNATSEPFASFAKCENL